jgi:hypothetical protein
VGGEASQSREGGGPLEDQAEGEEKKIRVGPDRLGWIGRINSNKDFWILAADLNSNIMIQKDFKIQTKDNLNSNQGFGQLIQGEFEVQMTWEDFLKYPRLF